MILVPPWASWKMELVEGFLGFVVWDDFCSPAGFFERDVVEGFCVGSSGFIVGDDLGTPVVFFEKGYFGRIFRFRRGGLSCSPRGHL